jgi:hypothetical protein
MSSSTAADRGVKRKLQLQLVADDECKEPSAKRQRKEGSAKTTSTKKDTSEHKKARIARALKKAEKRHAKELLLCQPKSMTTAGEGVVLSGTLPLTEAEAKLGEHRHHGDPEDLEYLQSEWHEAHAVSAGSMALEDRSDRSDNDRSDSDEELSDGNTDQDEADDLLKGTKDLLFGQLCEFAMAAGKHACHKCGNPLKVDSVDEPAAVSGTDSGDDNSDTHSTYESSSVPTMPFPQTFFASCSVGACGTDVMFSTRAAWGEFHGHAASVASGDDEEREDGV